MFVDPAIFKYVLKYIIVYVHAQKKTAKRKPSKGKVKNGKPQADKADKKPKKQRKKQDRQQSVSIIVPRDNIGTEMTREVANVICDGDTEMKEDFSGVVG